MIIGKKSSLNNGRWTLYSNGNNELYEENIAFGNIQDFIQKINSNALVFNYQGVGSSNGSISREGMKNAYRAMLSFLEDQEQGIGAKEIIGYGHSIGAAVQAEALLGYKLQNSIRYTFVKSRTFSELADVATSFSNKKFLGKLVKVLGWNMKCLKSSQQLTADEIIIQTAFYATNNLTDPKDIQDDGVINAEDSLLKKALEDPKFPREKKHFFGVIEGHNQALVSGDLEDKINELLQKPFSR